MNGGGLQKRAGVALLGAVAILAGCNGEMEPATNNTESSFVANTKLDCSAGEQLDWWWEYRPAGGGAWTQHGATTNNASCGQEVVDSNLTHTFDGLGAGTRHEYRICGHRDPTPGYSEAGPLCADSTQLRLPADSGAVWESTWANRDVVPGTGALLNSDFFSDPKPCTEWGNQQSPFTDECPANADEDAYFEQRSGGPTIPAIGQTAASEHYRRYISEAGVQSVSDEEEGNMSTRTQTQRWSCTNNPMCFPTGQRYVFYLSYRLQSPSPFPYDAGGGGLNKYSQLFQYKPHGGGLGTGGVPLNATIGRDGIKVEGDNPAGGEYQDVITHPIGSWIRLAIVVDWRDGGWYEVWMDKTGSGTMTQVTPRRTGIPLANGRPSFSWGIGLYHQMSLFDGTLFPEEPKPRQEIVYTDYANAQVASYVGG